MFEEGDLKTIPIEHYKISWKSFARNTITSISIPLKSVMIDSSSYRYHNGSDIYIARIIKSNLDNKQKAGISQAYRKLKETFMEDESVKAINRQIKEPPFIFNSFIWNIYVLRTLSLFLIAFNLVFWNYRKLWLTKRY